MTKTHLPKQNLMACTGACCAINLLLWLYSTSIFTCLIFFCRPTGPMNCRKASGPSVRCPFPSWWQFHVADRLDLLSLLMLVGTWTRLSLSGWHSSRGQTSGQAVLMTPQAAAAAAKVHAADMTPSSALSVSHLCWFCLSTCFALCRQRDKRKVAWG